MIAKLLLSKYQFQTGLKLIDPGKPMSGGVSISLFQDAVETLAWAVVTSFDADTKDITPFTQLWDVVKTAKRNTDAKELPLKLVMHELNRIRVLFKHHGVLPDMGEAERLSVQTEEFLRQTMEVFFNQSFDEVSVADAVINTEIRQHIKVAEKLLAEGLFDKAIYAAAAAEYFAVRPLERLLPEVDRNFNSVSQMLPREYSRIANEVARYLEKYLSALRTTTLIGISGQKPMQYQRFHNLVPHVHQTMDGKLHYSNKMGQGSRPHTETEAKFCISYVTDFAIELQERLGEP